MLNYTNYFESRNKKKIKEIYNSSFPKDERFPFWVLKQTAKSNNVIFNEISYDDKAIGIEYMIIDNDVAYLMYFAIDNDKRNGGYGSIVLKDLIKKYKTVILSIEKVYNSKSISNRRKWFYLRNGFYETHKYTKQNKVYYELLCSNKHYDLNKNRLINIYKNMTESKVLGYYINKKFELFDINFISEN